MALPRRDVKKGEESPRLCSGKSVLEEPVNEPALARDRGTCCDMTWTSL